VVAPADAATALAAHRADVLAAVRARCEASLRAFVRWVRPEHEPLPWHHEAYVEALQQWADAPEPYVLAVVMPPAHGKSYVARLALVWMILRSGHDYRCALASYSSIVAKDQFSELTSILRLPAIVQVWGDLIPRANERTKDGNKLQESGEHIRLRRGYGDLRALGVGGALTSFRLDAVICDDLIKNAAEAESQATRDTVWSWYTRSLLTRRRPGRPLRILLVGTRWHPDDPIGRVLSRQPDVKLLHLEALRDAVDLPRDPRDPGDALWPAVASRAQLERDRDLDPGGFVALYQGHPMPTSGYLYGHDCWARHEAIPACAGRWVQSWDMRHGGDVSKGKSSWAVGLLAFIPTHEPAKVYIADMWRERWDPAQTHDAFSRAQRIEPWCKARTVYVEEKADGIGVLSLFKARVPGLIGVKPTADKLTRARAVQPLIRAGQVSLPHQAPWLGAWQSEVPVYPGATSDDIVDALSQLLSQLYLQDDDPRAGSRRTLAAMLG
jgi:predicted phage terminase large subunit-like protein